MPKKALTVGITGQDGSYLAEFLLEKGQSIDLAFVITPGPVTLVVLTLGLIPVLLKRKR